MKKNTPEVPRVGEDGIGNQSEPRSHSKRKRTPISDTEGDDKPVVIVDDGESCDDKPVVTANNVNNKPVVTADGDEQPADDKLPSDAVTSSPPPSPVEIDNGDVRPVDSLPSVAISDLSVFDCCICCQSLTLPVFVCAKGHQICSSCHENEVKENCSKCSTKISRCGPIERILKSIKVSCIYKTNGCPKEFSYSSKRSHEWSCSYAPFGCPVADCTFVGCERKITLHVIKQHPSSVIRFCFGRPCPLPMIASNKCAVLVDEDKTLFFLDMNNRIALSCIDGPCLSAGDSYPYALVVEGKDMSLRFHCNAKLLFENGSKDFIQVSLDSFAPNYDGRLRISVYIYRNNYDYPTGVLDKLYR